MTVLQTCSTAEQVIRVAAADHRITNRVSAVALIGALIAVKSFRTPFSAFRARKSGAAGTYAGRCLAFGVLELAGASVSTVRPPEPVVTVLIAVLAHESCGAAASTIHRVTHLPIACAVALVQTVRSPLVLAASHPALVAHESGGTLAFTVDCTAVTVVAAFGALVAAVHTPSAFRTTLFAQHAREAAVAFARPIDAVTLSALAALALQATARSPESLRAALAAELPASPSRAARTDSRAPVACMPRAACAVGFATETIRARWANCFAMGASVSWLADAALSAANAGAVFTAQTITHTRRRID